MPKKGVKGVKLDEHGPARTDMAAPKSVRIGPFEYKIVWMDIYDGQL
jgi:hypothetical protein